MKDEGIKKYIKDIYGALVLEDIISHEARKKIKEISGVIALFSLVAIIFVGGISPWVKALFCFALLAFILGALSDAYFFYFFRRNSRLSDSLPFEIAQIIFYSKDGDLVRGFIYSEIGDEVMKRLGFSEEELRTFLINKTDLSVSDFVSDGTPSFKDYVDAVYGADQSFKEFLESKAVKAEDLFGAIEWVLGREEKRIEEEMWWSDEALSRIQGIGKNWSYGQTFLLEKYGDDITTHGSSHFESYEASQSESIRRLEQVLSRSESANALVISSDEASRMDLVRIFARRISIGNTYNFLAKKRVYLLNPNLIIENTGDKISFEKEWSEVLMEAIRSRNTIIVLPNLSSFIKNAETLNSDALSVLMPFLASPLLQIIALDSKEAFHEVLEGKSAMMERFEVVRTEGADKTGVLGMLKEKAIQVEASSHVFFTYPAIAAIARESARYFDSYSYSDKASDILVESVPFMATRGRKVVTKEDVLELISEKVGVPVSAPKQEERERLTNLEESLAKRIVGQSEAVKAISSAIKRSRSGVGNPDKPIGSFLFLGPTGVGKTETTKALADIFFGSKENISRLDMSEFRTADALNRLIGGFGEDTAGVLPKLLKERPYGVLLLDEFEKTTPEVMNLFLQILDEGAFSDAKGNKVIARNNIIIATSNAGSDLIWQIFQGGENPVAHKDEIVDFLIQKAIYKPELLNRFDGVILFNPLTKNDLARIAGLMLEKLGKRMEEKGIYLEKGDGIIEYLVTKGTDPKFGARPMNRAIQEEIEQKIAEKIIAGDIHEGSKAVISADSSGVLVFPKR